MRAPETRIQASLPAFVLDARIIPGLDPGTAHDGAQ